MLHVNLGRHAQGCVAVVFTKAFQGKSIKLLQFTCLLFLSIFFVLLGAAKANLVATTSGDFAVNANGGASYSIPITVAPGSGVMQPSISLEYNSQGRHGLLGMGWSIGGLSSIHRCPATLARDNFKDGIDFDSNDRFCIDGQPLLVVSGTYGASGAEYRTEINSFSKIISNGTSGSGPESFTVWTKAGEIMEYGFTDDSRINLPSVSSGAQDSAINWLVSKISDRKSNYMEFTYFESTTTGENYPLKIEYTGNVSAGVTPYNVIEFEYENTAGGGFKFIGGQRSYQTKRLSKVISKAEGTTLREYNLSYTVGQSTGRSRISSIQECDRYNNCMDPTVFEVNDTPIQHEPVVSQPDGMWGTNSSTESYRYVGDYNGDGRADVISCDFNKTHSVGTTSNGFYIGLHPLNANDLCQYSTATGNGLSNRLYVMDVNGDGKSDMVGVGTGATLIGLSRRTTNNNFEFNFVKSYYGEIFNNSWFSSTYPGRVIAMDVNGDGRDDLVAIGTGTTLVALSNGTSFDAPIQSAETLSNGWFGTTYGGRVRQVDANGDGMADIVAIGTGTTITALSNGTGFDVSTGPEIFNNNFFNTYSTRVFDADVNGDGLVDFIGLTDSHTEVSFNTGAGFATPNLTAFTFGSNYWNYYKYKNRIHVGDINGDGKSDLYALGSPSYVAVSNGLAFDVMTTSANIELDAFHYVLAHSVPYANVMDVDGNGKSDIVWSDPILSTGQTLRTFTWYSDEILTDQVTKITNGFDVDIEIEYRPLSDSNGFYTRSDTNQAPTVSDDRIIQGPLYVVNKTDTDDGIGGVSTLSYSYFDAKVNNLGRGFLGFASRSALKIANNVYEGASTYYKQEFPFIGQIYQSSSHQTDQNTQEAFNQSEVNTLAFKGTVGSGPVYPYVASSLKRNSENGVNITSVTTTETYDDYGNLKHHTVNTVDATGTYTDYSLNYYNSPDLGNWILGRLYKSHSFNNHNSVYSAFRTSEFEYDLQSGQLTKEILAQNTNFELSKTYTHDGFGNITQVDIDGADITARTESITTYDPKGRYPVSIKNAKNHEELREYTDPHGLVSKVTGPNGLSTYLYYDTLGRKYFEIRADGTTTITTYVSCTPPTTCPAHTNSTPAYKISTITSGSPTKTEYFDAVNRVIISEYENFDGKPNLTFTEYDSKGRVARKSLPEIDYGGGVTPYYWTEYAYDASGRVVSENSSSTGLTTYTYNGLLVSVTNALNQTTEEYKNSLGQTLWAKDDDGKLINYEYDSHSNLTKVTDPSNNVVINTYDAYGRKLTMNDPDMGLWKYSYNVLGELVAQWDANTNHSGTATVSILYDDLGRMVSRTEAEGTTTWTYDAATKGVGKLTSESMPGGFSRTYTYDVNGRPASNSTVIGGSSYTISTTYDIHSRVLDVTYPSGFQVTHMYNSIGYLEKIVDGNNVTKEYWKKSGVDDFENATTEMIGSVFSIKSYEDATGRLTVSAGFGSGIVQNLTFDFDVLGNLVERKDNLQALTETLQYDNLNRLDQSDITGVGINTYAYDSLGNITSKSDVGAYTYGQNNAGPHAVTQTSGLNNASYTYDANGNQLAGDGRTITWSSYNKPTLINKGSSSSAFEYGPDRARYKQTLNTSSGVSTTTYIGSLYEKIVTSSVTTDRNYIFAEGKAVAIYESRSNGTDDERYLLRDHLGSVDTITDENGAVVEKLSFDAFGKRRQVNWQAAIGIIASIITRGFTGHEMLDAVGLIHMNGRVYDATLGRFISADPNIQVPKNLQNLNRYSYVMNNPLSYTDPSGFFIKGLLRSITKAIGSVFKSVFKNPNSFMAIFAITAGFLTGNFVLAKAGLQGLSAAVAAGAAGGFVAGFIGSGGNFKAGVIGALAGGALGGIGFNFRDVAPYSTGHFQKIALHGAVGGAANAANGGKFGRGFASAGIAQAAAPGIDEIPGASPSLARTAAAAVVGGTTSELTGGKFANGAITGAYSRLFDEISTAARKQAQQRQAGNIYVTGHSIGGAGPTHIAIEFTDGNGLPVTLSAGSKNGNLFSDINRPTDSPRYNFTVDVVTPPQGITSSQYFQRLKVADAIYCDCVDYDAIPGIGNGYNSNSYVSGLIQATGGSTSKNLGRYVGGNQPLPANYFGF